MPNLASYANINDLVNDPSYAKSKHLIVKKYIARSSIIEALEDKLREIPSDSENWREKVDNFKREIAKEKAKSTRYVIKYDKQYITPANQTTLGLFRSVITDGDNVMCYAPPKSLSFEKFQKESEEANREYTEYCEGTMINLYFDTTLGDWEIATRSNIGARCKFYQNATLTFRQMFLEAFTFLKLEFSDFNPSYCYSFVLQHPENRIVVPFIDKKLILTNVYRCKGAEVEAVPLKLLWTHPLRCQFPPALCLCDSCSLDLEHVTENIQSKGDLDYTLPGAVVVDSVSGTRFKVRNPKYEYVRHLKGNNPKLQYQYYNLRQKGKVKEYLQYYPEDIGELTKFRTQLHFWTTTLWKNYVNCYVNKVKPLREYPFEFRSHVYALHQDYLNNLRANKNIVTKRVVIDYVNNLPPDHLMASINYPLRNIKSKTKAEHIQNVCKSLQTS